LLLCNKSKEPTDRPGCTATVSVVAASLDYQFKLTHHPTRQTNTGKMGETEKKRRASIGSCPRHAETFSLSNTKPKLFVIISLINYLKQQYFNLR